MTVNTEETDILVIGGDLTVLAYAVLLIMGYMSKPLVFMVILMGSTFLGGAWFCGWLRPFWFTQEWLGKPGRLLRFPQIRVSLSH
jgi:polyferredoxin